jgi:hypothetical protein
MLQQTETHNYVLTLLIFLILLLREIGLLTDMLTCCRLS